MTEKSEDNPLLVGFIGGGLNSAVGETHKIAIQMDGQFKLVAGCFSRNPEINIKTGKRWQLDSKRVYSSAKNLIDQEQGKLDAICVLTPTPTHEEIVLDCIKSGIPVICEKSLTSSLRQAKNIAETIRAYGGRLVITYNYTGYPMIRELRHRIQEGELGQIHQILVEMPQEGFLRQTEVGQPLRPQSWRLQDLEIPTVSLDLGAHLHHLIDFLTGQDVQEVLGVESCFGAFGSIVDNIHCIAKYTNAMIANIWYGKTALGYRNGLRIRVFGENGSAEWVQMDPEHLLWVDRYGTRQMIDRSHPTNSIANQARYNRFKVGHPAGFIEAFSNYYVDIALNQKRGESLGYVAGIQSALKGLQFLYAVAKSSQRCVWQKCNDSIC